MRKLTDSEKLQKQSVEIINLKLEIKNMCKNRSYSDTKTENIRTPYRSTLGQ